MSQGFRTKVGDAVSQSTRRAQSNGASQQPRQQTFTSPGTWTWPGNVTYVQVLLVGGGGGGAAQHVPPVVTNGNISGAGGGGGVRMEFEVPVSAPVPVTVGAGGTGGPSTSPNARHGGKGGDSSFGPISVGGGGGGMSGQPTSAPTASTYVPAPPNGGSPGGCFSPYALSALAGGTYGCYGAVNTKASGAGSSEGFGRYGYGAGGNSEAQVPGPVSPFYPGVATATYTGASTLQGGSGRANSGAGGNGWATSPPAPPVGNGGAGGSGIVIVSWWE